MANAVKKRSRNRTLKAVNVEVEGYADTGGLRHTGQVFCLLSQSPMH